jgi:uncharacterized membrane protein
MVPPLFASTALDEFTEISTDILEWAGVAIVVFGAALAAVRWCLRTWRREADTYKLLRLDLAQAIILGLEVLVAADIVDTVVIDRTLEAVAVLALLVLVRISLSWSLVVEIEGAWPWQRRKLDEIEAGVVPPAANPSAAGADGDV